jgi:FkbM family methyltransferase
MDMQELQGKGFGGTTEGEARMALEFTSQRDVKNPIVLDIGANSGSYAEAIRKLSPQATVFAFEPSSFARKSLEDRFKGDSAVNIVSFALGNKNSKETLWSDIPGGELASLTKRKLDHFGINFNLSESVEVVTLDSWASTAQVVPDLIKIDVEGHELDVLKGGINTLALTKVVQFEFGGTQIDTKTFFRDYWYLLSEAGFILYRISESGPIRIAHYSELDECFRFTNYIAVKK